ncbi:MAG: PEP-CTERM sorting domain-containing protein [Rubrivivax sp.]|nr:PEP-CTERM sorting domain-containing protein [Rubrivivax sp.]
MMNLPAHTAWTKFATPLGGSNASPDEDTQQRAYVPTGRHPARATHAWRALGALALFGGLHASAAAWDPFLKIGMGSAGHEASCFNYPQREATVAPLRGEQTCALAPSEGYLRSGHAEVGAEYGLLRTTAAGHTTGNNPFWSVMNTGGFLAQFQGVYRFDGPTSEVDVSVNLVLDGTLASELSGERSGTELNLWGGGIVQGITTLHVGSDGAARLTANTLAPGADWLSLASPSGAHLELQTSKVRVSTGIEQPLLLNMGTSFMIQKTGSAAFDLLLTFPLYGALVFNLPDGYTVSGNGIVDNLWVGAIPAVPEPASALLLALGMGVVTWRARKRPR